MVLINVEFYTSWGKLNFEFTPRNIITVRSGARSNISYFDMM